MDNATNGGASSTAEALKVAITQAVPDAKVEVLSSGGGHYSLEVRSTAFRDRSTLERHRMVYTAIAALMAGDTAPVHAIDTLKTATD
ncbi:MAG TPA: BolA/IbaG family iron-sulfur metabolism protein [Polyangiaceae bacterium]|nr:BolA/IbaG family iron-sulfur metabolism protein [Polyangiaceae bacterium]